MVRGGTPAGPARLPPGQPDDRCRRQVRRRRAHPAPRRVRHHRVAPRDVARLARARGVDPPRGAPQAAPRDHRRQARRQDPCGLHGGSGGGDPPGARGRVPGRLRRRSFRRWSVEASSSHRSRRTSIPSSWTVSCSTDSGRVLRDGEDPEARHGRGGDPDRRRPGREASRTEGRGGRCHREPVRGEVRRGPHAARRRGGGARGAAGEEGHGGPRRPRRVLREGRGRRRGRRIRARRRAASSEARRAPSRGGRRGQGHHPLGQEARRPRHDDRRPAPLQGRGVRAHPLRRDGGTAPRRAARRRDRARDRRHGRPHPRVGGLTKDEAKKEDGLR